MYSFANQVVTGADEIFKTLTNIRNMLAGERAEERLVHVVENLQCCAFAKRGVMTRVSGTFVVGTHFVPTGLSFSSQVCRNGCSHSTYFLKQLKEPRSNLFC